LFVVARFHFVKTNGTELAQYSLDIEVSEVVLDLEPFKNRSDQSDIGWGYANVLVTRGSGVLTSASVIDSKTNDATTVTCHRRCRDACGCNPAGL
jgi:hypothetical protein